jgi:hypothetical protein
MGWQIAIGSRQNLKSLPTIEYYLIMLNLQQEQNHDNMEFGLVHP